MFRYTKKQFVTLKPQKPMDKQERKAVISIEMDSSGNFEIRFDWDNSLRLSMMGALDFGKDYLKDQIRQQSAISASETCRKNESEYNTEKVQSVSKNEALNIYLTAYETIKARLTAIAGTDDRATYQVPDFIKKL